MIGLFSTIAPYVLLMLIAVIVFELASISHKKAHPRKPVTRNFNRKRAQYRPLPRPRR